MSCSNHKFALILLSTVAVSIPAAAANSIDWKSLIPKIREVLKQTFPEERIEEHYALGILAQTDITGDGLPEAVVYLGTGGASTDEVTLMRIENDSPVVQRFKEKNGAVGTHIFLRGASAMHSDDFKFIPEKQAVYSFSSRNDSEGRLADCRVTAYKWNTSTKTFDWSHLLSSQIKRKVCQKIGT